MTGYLFFTFLLTLFVAVSIPSVTLQMLKELGIKFPPVCPKLRYRNHHGPQSASGRVDVTPKRSSGQTLAGQEHAIDRRSGHEVLGVGGKRACLDAIKMQHLTKLGFQFRPRGSYALWNDQMKGPWKFL